MGGERYVDDLLTYRLVDDLLEALDPFVRLEGQGVRSYYRDQFVPEGFLRPPAPLPHLSLPPNPPTPPFPNTPPYPYIIIMALTAGIGEGALAE